MARPRGSVLIGSVAHAVDRANIPINTTKTALTQRITPEDFIVLPPQKAVNRIGERVKCQVHSLVLAPSKPVRRQSGVE